MQGYYKVEELANMFKINKVTARRWAKDGRFNAVKVGRRWYFSRETIEKEIGEDKQI